MWLGALVRGYEALFKVLQEAGGEVLTRAEMEEWAGKLKIGGLNRVLAELKKRADNQFGKRGGS